MIAVLRGKSMKKVILKATAQISPNQLDILSKDLNDQWENGFMVVPDYFKVQLVDAGWTQVEKQAPPLNQLVLVWMEYENGENTCQTYGFGKYDGDGWIVYLQAATQIIAWAFLPEPYKV